MLNKKSLLGYVIGIGIGSIFTSFISSSVELTNFWQSIAILLLAINSIRYEREINANHKERNKDTDTF